MATPSPMPPAEEAMPVADRSTWGKLFSPHSPWRDPRQCVQQRQRWQARGNRESLAGLLPRLEHELHVPSYKSRGSSAEHAAETLTLDLSLEALRLKLPGIGDRPCLVLAGQCGAELSCVRCGQACFLNFAYHRVLVLCSSGQEAETVDQQLEQDPETMIPGLSELTLSMDHCDTVVVTESFSIRDCLEDELLLSLPSYPRHEQCP